MIAAALFASTAAVVVLQEGPAGGSGRPDPEGRLGPHVRTLVNLLAPSDVELAADGTLWVLERDGHRASRFAPRGGRDAVVGGLGDGPGDGPGQLRFPRGLALDPAGGLLVADTENDRVVRFDADGAFVEVLLGAGGALDPGLRWPEGLDARGGRVAVCDRGRRRVLVVARGEAGPALEAILGAAAPDGSGALLDPVDVQLVGDGGALVVADAGLHEVVAFDETGAERWRIGGFGHFPGQLAGPSGLDVQGDRVYVADGDNHRVQVFDLGGGLLYEWGKHALAPGQGEGYLHYPSAVAVLPGGPAAVVAEAFAGRVQRFGPADGPPGLYRNDPSTLSPDAAGHVGPPLAAAGRLAVTIEPETQQLHFHDLGSRSGTPILVHRAGGFGDRPGQFRGLVDVALAPDGRRALALDARDRRLSEFAVGALDADGPRRDRRLAAFARSIDLTRLAPELLGADALALAPDGAVLIADAAGRRVYAVAPDWKSARVVHPADGASAPRRIVDLAVNARGDRIALADAGARAVTLLDGAGAAVARLEDVEPGGVAFDAEHRLWVTDRLRGDLRAYTERDGALVPGERIGRGAGAALREPRGVAPGPDGRLVVVDHGDHLLCVLDADGRLVAASGPQAYLRARADAEDGR